MRNKNMIVSVVLAISSLTGVSLIAAETKQPSVAKMTPEQRTERSKRISEARYRTTGGKIVKPDSMKGSIVFYNGQSTFDDEAVVSVARRLRQSFKLDISVVKTNPPTHKTAFESIRAKKSTFGIFIVSDMDDPTTLSIYPEQRFAFVNAGAIGGNDIRFQRELTRAFALLCGAASSQYPQTLLSPVLSPIDIDTMNTDQLPIDLIMRMNKYLEAFEVTPEHSATYRTAVTEGWAPAPTNDIQKAIWEKVHAPPSKPLKITYDKAKQKPVLK